MAVFWGRGGRQWDGGVSSEIKTIVWMQQKRANKKRQQFIQAAANCICPIPFFFFLTPLLPQPVKFQGWKMLGRAYKQYIFQSCNTPASNAMHFDENPPPPPPPPKKTWAKFPLKCILNLQQKRSNKEIIASYAHYVVVKDPSRLSCVSERRL